MSEQYMATVIYQRLEELRSDVFWGWTKARVDEIKELFDEYLSTQAGERKDLFLKVTELEEKVRVLEGQIKFKDEELINLRSVNSSLAKKYNSLKNGANAMSDEIAEVVRQYTLAASFGGDEIRAGGKG